MRGTISLSTGDVGHVLLALGALLVAAHALGSVFAHFRQPRVIGEILGGLLLGPTLLGHLAPGVEKALFPSTGAVPPVLGAVLQLGLLLLLFCSGTEIRTSFGRGDRRTVGAVFLTGMIIPFVAGLGLVHVFGGASHWGPNGNSTSFLLIFAIAMAITSIPVISRIMHDLGILDTRFARIVLGVAVLEDIVLYVVLAIALGFAQGSSGSLFGLPAMLHVSPGSALDLTYHVLVTGAVLALLFVWGPTAYRTVSGLRANLIQRSSPVGFQLAFMIAATVACLFLGIEAFFGAFMAGIVVGAVEGDASPAVRAIKSFSFAFFVPVYFALVGLQLDLVHGFNPLFFLAFLAAACAVKAASVYVGARAAGETNTSSLNLAIAMNARGGPGIVVASVAFGAGIIDEPFYAVLVLLAIITSLVAGSWLERVPRDRLLTRKADAETSAVSAKARRTARQT
jgi:K+:H+ antiporter